MINQKLLDYIPSWRINDVVYFNPADVEHPIGFNILESVDPEMKHLVAAGMMSVFKKIWEGVWSARMEYILNNAILALMDTPGTTLLGINRMLSDTDYRTQIISNIKDPIVKQFWIKEFGGYQASFASEAVAPIQNKVGQFLSAGIIRNIVAQANSAMNIRQIMDEQKIFIVDLSKGRLGEDASRLLGGLIITKLQMSAMERVDMPEEERQDFYMYVDEFQNFAVESFASILSEARKYRLNLIMAHQYIAQLTEEVRDAVFGNVGTLISFRVGSPDAAFMEEEFMPRFVPADLVNLPKFQIYLKLMIDGITSQPFSATTLPPIAVKTGSSEKVIAQSRERYAGVRAKIEEKVSEWSGFGKDVDVAVEMKKVSDDKKAAKKERFSHDYDCTRCGKTFKLPVELDRNRPIYCEECHPIVMEERKGGKKGDKGDVGNKGKKRVVSTPPKVSDGVLVTKGLKSTEKEVDISLDQLMGEEEDANNKEQETGGQNGVPSATEGAKGGETIEPSCTPRAADMVVPTKTEIIIENKVDVEHTQLKSTIESEQPEKKKRRRSRKKKSPDQRTDSVRINAPVQNSQASTQPTAPVSREPQTPKPVMPNERITFDE